MPHQQTIKDLQQRTIPLEAFWIKKDLVSSAPGPFNKALTLLATLALCLIVLTASLFLIIYGSSNPTTAISMPFIVTGSILLGLLVCFILYFFLPPLTMLLCHNPPKPEPSAAFILNGEVIPEKITHNSVYIIYNPISGLGKSSKVLNQTILPQLDANGINYTICQTKYSGHIRDYLYGLPFTPDYTGVILLGGDGTLFEAVNGLMARPDQKKLPLALFPTGSGNSYSSDLGHTGDYELTMRRFLDGTVMWSDAVRVRDATGLHHSIKKQQQEHAEQPIASDDTTHCRTLASETNPLCLIDDTNNDNTPTLQDILGGDYTGLDVYSVNVSCIGLVGDVAITAEKCRCLGVSRYDICGMWGMLKSLYWPITAAFLTSDERIVSGTFPSLTTVLTTTQYMGRGHHVAPRAQLNDGVSDITICRTATIGELLTIFLQLPHGSHIHVQHRALMQFKVYSGLLIVYDDDKLNAQQYQQLCQQYTEVYQHIRRNPPITTAKEDIQTSPSSSHTSSSTTTTTACSSSSSLLPEPSASPLPSPLPSIISNDQASSKSLTRSKRSNLVDNNSCTDDDSPHKNLTDTTNSSDRASDVCAHHDNDADKSHHLLSQKQHTSTIDSNTTTVASTSTHMPTDPPTRRFPIQTYSTNTQDITQLNDLIPLSNLPMSALREAFLTISQRLIQEITPAKAIGFVNVDGEVFRYDGVLYFETIPNAFQIFASPESTPSRL